MKFTARKIFIARPKYILCVRLAHKYRPFLLNKMNFINTPTIIIVSLLVLIVVLYPVIKGNHKSPTGRSVISSLQSQLTACNQDYDTNQQTLTNLQENRPALVLKKTTFTQGEPIIVKFHNGPGNPKDWIAVFTSDQTPGLSASKQWRYVDNTDQGKVGLYSGTITISDIIYHWQNKLTPGLYKIYFLKNDTYVIMAETPVITITRS